MEMPGDDGLTRRLPVTAVSRHRALLIFLTALAVVAALVADLSMPRRYQATAELLLSRTDPALALLNPTRDAAATDFNTEVGLIKQDRIARSVAGDLGLRTSRAALLGQVTIQADATSDVVSLQVTDSLPARAAAIANAFAQTYVAFRQKTARQLLLTAAGLARAQLIAMPRAEQASASGLQLQDRGEALRIAAGLQTGGAQFTVRASPPTSPTRPPLASTGAAAAVVGAVLAMIAALALELVEPRFTDAREVGATLGLPILGTIPRHRASGSAGGRPAEDAYGLLAANLGFGVRDRPPRILMVASSAPEEGKTTVTLRLATSIARTGLRVIVIEADLRRPRMAGYLNLAPGPGLGGILAGSATLTDTLTWLDIPSAAPPLGAPERPSVGVVTAGVRAEREPRNLGGSKMADTLEAALALVDVVLVNTAPVTTGGEGIALASLVEATLLVVRLGHTTREGARRATRLLDAAGRRPLGVVMIGSRGPARQGSPRGGPPDRVRSRRRSDERTVGSQGALAG